jgi:hypothetical protein
MELLNGILYLVLGLLVLIYFMNKCGCRRVEGIEATRRLDLDPIDDGTCVCKNPKWDDLPFGLPNFIKSGNPDWCADKDGKRWPYVATNNLCRSKLNQGQTDCEAHRIERNGEVGEGLCQWNSNYYQYCHALGDGEGINEYGERVADPGCHPGRGGAGHPCDPFHVPEPGWDCDAHGYAVCCDPPRWPRDDGTPYFPWSRPSPSPSPPPSTPSPSPPPSTPSPPPSTPSPSPSPSTPSPSSNPKNINKCKSKATGNPDSCNDNNLCFDQYNKVCNPIGMANYRRGDLDGAKSVCNKVVDPDGFNYEWCGPSS